MMLIMMSILMVIIKMIIIHCNHNKQKNETLMIIFD